MMPVVSNGQSPAARPIQGSYQLSWQGWPSVNWRRRFGPLLVLLLSSLILFGWFNAHATSVQALTCTNSIYVSVFADNNDNGLHEPTELALPGTVRIVGLQQRVLTFQSPAGLFDLMGVACDEYSVYHNDDYVGQLFVEEVMGTVLIELPKNMLKQHIFMPIILH